MKKISSCRVHAGLFFQCHSRHAVLPLAIVGLLSMFLDDVLPNLLFTPRESNFGVSVTKRRTAIWWPSAHKSSDQFNRSWITRTLELMPDILHRIGPSLSYQPAWTGDHCTEVSRYIEGHGLVYHKLWEFGSVLSNIVPKYLRAFDFFHWVCHKDVEHSKGPPHSFIPITSEHMNLSSNNTAKRRSCKGKITSSEGS